MRVGIVGAGGVAQAFHLPVLEQTEAAQIMWICDTHLPRARELARRFRVPEVFDDIRRCTDVDAALVAIPVGCRDGVYEELLARQWHVFAEKPVARSARAHDGLVTGARAAGVEVCAALVRRLYQSTTLAKRLFATDVFGPPVEVWAAQGARLYASQRSADWYQADPSAAGGGVLMEAGSHLVDQLLFVLDATSFCDVRADVTIIDGIDVDVRAAAILTTATQQSVPVRIALSHTTDLPGGIVIRYQHATIRLGIEPNFPLSLETEHGRAVACLNGDDRGARTLYQAFYLEWEAFLEQCRSRTPSVIDAATALAGAEFVDAVYSAARSAVAR